MEQATLKVSGMTCGHCVKSVEKAVGELPGVESVTVDLKGGVAKVRFEPRTTNVAAIVSAITDAGFETTAG